MLPCGAVCGACGLDGAAAPNVCAAGGERQIAAAQAGVLAGAHSWQWEESLHHAGRLSCTEGSVGEGGADQATISARGCVCASAAGRD
eukprot:scaffold69616_cov18-Phaeocystis_antarctica.AAC.1